LRFFGADDALGNSNVFDGHLDKRFAMLRQPTRSQVAVRAAASGARSRAVEARVDSPAHTRRTRYGQNAGKASNAGTSSHRPADNLRAVREVAIAYPPPSA